MDTPFDRFAPFYDSDIGEFDEDIPLYLNFARRTGDPILEVGCGTGRVLLPLAKAGYHVTGVDISLAMLARAKAKAAKAHLLDRIRLVQSDVRELALGQTFALIIYAANSFMHHTTQEEQLHVLRRLREHLRPGGLLILDLFNPDLDILQRADGRVEWVRSWEDEEQDATVVKFLRVHASPTHQMLDVTYIYDRVYRDGRVERTLAPFQLRYLWPAEARLLIRAAGLTLEAMYGSYDLDPVDDEHPRLIIVARETDKTQ